MMITDIDRVAELLLQSRAKEIHSLASGDGLVARFLAMGIAIGMASHADQTMEPLADYAAAQREMVAA